MHVVALVVALILLSTVLVVSPFIVAPSMPEH
jgi:hypothetical protein